MKKIILHKKKHLLYVEDPHIKSYASYILLKNRLKNLDDEPTWAIELKKYLKFREEFLNESKIDGKLICVYCQRDDLVEGHHEFKNKNLNNNIPNLATIDHIIPISKGGSKYDKSNCCISCKKCNQKKADKMPK